MFIDEECVSGKLCALPKAMGLSGSHRSGTLRCKARKLGKSGICLMKLSVGISESTLLE